ncbi:hypothetical protein KQH82_05480 [bacterium]|nr:hypothetical protein [bacterium]
MTSNWYIPILLVAVGVFLWFRVRWYRAERRSGKLDRSDRAYFGGRIVEGIIILIVLLLLWLGVR